MKKRYVTILVLAIGAIVLLCGALPCWAEEKEAEKEDESIWVEIDPGGPTRIYSVLERAPTEEEIAEFIEVLAETKPEEAAELEKLQKENPKEFKREITKLMAKRFGRIAKLPNWHRQFRSRGGRGEPSAGRTRGKRAMYRRRGPGFDEWLAENYPEEAKKLAELEEKDPELRRRRYGLCQRRYGRIYQAAKENPELVEILKEDLELKEKRDKLLSEIRAGVSEDEKTELVKELEEVLGQRFDLIVKRKQIEYERLLERLKELQERVKQSEAQVAKWKEAKFKNTSVKGRLEELVGKVEKFRWE